MIPFTLLLITGCTTFLSQQLYGPVGVALLQTGPALTLFLQLTGVLDWLLPSQVASAIQWLLSVLPLWQLLKKLVSSTCGPDARSLPLHRAAAADFVAAVTAVVAALLPAGWTHLLKAAAACVALTFYAKLFQSTQAKPPHSQLSSATGRAASSHHNVAYTTNQSAQAEELKSASAKPNNSPQQAAWLHSSCMPRPSQVTLLLYSFQAPKVMQLGTTVLIGLGVLNSSSDTGIGVSVLTLCNLMLTFVWPQVAATYMLMLHFSCKVTQKQHRLLRAVVRLPSSSASFPDLVGTEANTSLEMLRHSISSQKRSSSEEASEQITPRESLGDLVLDPGFLYRISEGSESQRMQQDPDIDLGLQHLLMVACSGSVAGLGSNIQSPRRSRLSEPRAECCTDEVEQQTRKVAHSDAQVQCEASMPTIAAEGSSNLQAEDSSIQVGSAALAEKSEKSQAGQHASKDLDTSIIMESGAQQNRRAPGGRDSVDAQELVALVAALQGHASDLAHDLKNPLNGVLALSQNVLQGSFGELPPAACKQLGVVHACGHHLLNMINMARDMLCSLNGGDLELSDNKVQVSTPIDEVMNRMGPMVGSRITVHVNRSEAHTVIADGARLYQVVHVVLVNAFKYTRKGSVSVDTEVEEDTGHAIIRVTDTGPGFTSEQLAKYNAPLTGSSNEQVGLGLMMVKRLMGGFGGALRLRNVGGEDTQTGAVVELVFRAERSMHPVLKAPTVHSQPVAQAASSNAEDAQLSQDKATQPSAQQSLQLQENSAASRSSTDASAAAQGATHGLAGKEADSVGAAANKATNPSCHRRRDTQGSPDQYAFAHRHSGKSRDEDASTHASEGQGHTILIVDDDPINVSILQDLLRSAAYETLVGGTGNEGLEMYVSANPPVKLVLLDVTLPDMSGHEVCTKMRSLAPGVPPPIIMISGRASTKDVVKGLQAGSQDYICKPFQPQEVLARIETQLRLYMGEMQQLQETAEYNAELMKQVLPPHVLASLNGGSRILVEKIPSACLLQVEVVGFSALAAHADTSDCILMLNRIFSVFDEILDLHGVHKIETVGATYQVAAGHLADESDPQGHPGRLLALLQCGTSMLEAVSRMQFPEAVGMMEVRMGLHMGPLYTGVLGIKLPRYCLFGTTQRLTTALQQAALPMTIHVSEVVYNKIKGILRESSFVLYTSSTLPGMGIFKTFLVLSSGYDAAALATFKVHDYLEATALEGSSHLQVLQTFVGNRASKPKHFQASSIQGTHAPQQHLYQSVDYDNSQQQRQELQPHGSPNLAQAHAQQLPSNQTPMEFPAQTQTVPTPHQPQSQPPLPHEQQQQHEKKQPQQLVPLLPSHVQQQQRQQETRQLLPQQLKASPAPSQMQQQLQQHQHPKSLLQQPLLQHQPPEPVQVHQLQQQQQRLPVPVPPDFPSSALPLMPSSSLPPPAPLEDPSPPSRDPASLPQTERSTSHSFLGPVSPQWLQQASSSSHQASDRLPSVGTLPTQPPNPSASVPVSRAQPLKRAPPKNLQECLQPLGMCHYAKVLEDEGVGLAELAKMNDNEMRRAGLITERARKIIKEELEKAGLR